MIVLGIDPGKTTGLCWIPTTGGSIGKQVVYPNIFQMLPGICGSDVVVMESAVKHGSLTEGKVSQLMVMGAVEYLCATEGLDLIYITPEERGRVKKVPSHIEGVHAKDAYRVAMAYLIREGKVNVADYLSTKGS